MQSADKEITVFSKDGKLFQIGINIIMFIYYL